MSTKIDFIGTIAQTKIRLAEDSGQLVLMHKKSTTRIGRAPSNYILSKIRQSLYSLPQLP